MRWRRSSPAPCGLSACRSGRPSSRSPRAGAWSTSAVGSPSHGDEVRALARGQRADVGQAKVLGAGGGGGSDGFDRREAGLRPSERTPVRFSPCLPTPMSVPKATLIPASWARRPIACMSGPTCSAFAFTSGRKNVSGLAASRATVYARDERRHEPGALGLEQLDGFRVEVGAVLDGVDARAQGGVDAAGSVGVCLDHAAHVVGGLHDGDHLCVRELLAPRPWPRRPAHRR